MRRKYIVFQRREYEAKPTVDLTGRECNGNGNNQMCTSWVPEERKNPAALLNAFLNLFISIGI